MARHEGIPTVSLSYGPVSSKIINGRGDEIARLFGPSGDFPGSDVYGPLFADAPRLAAQEERGLKLADEVLMYYHDLFETGRSQEGRWDTLRELAREFKKGCNSK